jgi:hydrogenase expression/formation protein HypE
LVDRHQLGKLNAAFFKKVIFPRLGKSRSDVVNGPMTGGDTSAIRLDDQRVLVTTSDPLSYLPSIGAKDSAYLSVHLLASDLTTSGFSPQYGVFDFNLPMTMSDREFANYWTAFHFECKKLGIAIVGGHTGRYLGRDDTIIGGGTLFAIGPNANYLTSSMAFAEDDLILTKGAAIEATAVLTRSFPRIVKKTLGPEAFEQAWNYLRMVTTVKDASCAVSVGRKGRGVTAMHDATEGGVLNAAAEMAEASRLGVKVNLPAIQVSDETLAICKLFKLDPLCSLSEGSLLIASRPFGTARVVKGLFQKGIQAKVIGLFSNKFRGLRAATNRGLLRIAPSQTDKYWAAYWEATRKGWT